jgi:hypothetical protein
MKTTIALIALSVALTFAPASAQTAKLKVLHDFAAYGSNTDGSVPYGPLVFDSKGNLYGVTIVGGTGQCGDYGCGTLYELSPAAGGAWDETIPYDFAAADGSPWGALIFDRAGNIYGTTLGFGSAVYELSPGSGTWSYNVLYSDGAGPGLLMGSDGDLYGAIGPGDYYGLGAIGELLPGSGGWTYNQLYSFTCDPSCAGGYNPPAPPIWDSKGNLWGTMFTGGIGRPACANDAGGCGVIFDMTPNDDGTWNYQVIHRFASSPTDGQFPDAGLTLDAAGNFYGDTEGGGTHNLGIIFEFSVSDGKVKGSIIHNFSNCSTGCYPEGTLAIDKSGNLYGMAQGGPNSCGFSCGVVFKLAPQKNGTWKYSVVYNLDETTGGALPYYGLILDNEGNLYGVTSSGGQYGGGTAFEITQ